MHVCGNGHEIRGPEDRLNNGACRTCQYDYNAKYREEQRRKVRLAAAFLDAVESRNLAGFQALALIRQADPMTIEECVRQDFAR